MPIPHAMPPGSARPRIHSWVLSLLLAVGVNSAATVDFKGLNASQEANVRALMRLTGTGCETGPWRVKRLYRDALQELRDALQALGYYNIEVDAGLNWRESCWHASFIVNTGEPTRLRQVDLQIDGPGQNDTEVQAYLATHALQAGDILHHGDYRRFRDRLLDLLIQRGYFEARYLNKRVDVAPDTHTADLSLRLASGPRYHFGEVRFTPGILDTQLLERYTDIKLGDPYNATALSALSAALNNSGYFGSVSIDADTPDAASRSVAVMVNLTPGKPRRYTAGMGFTTDTGPQTRLGYVNHRRNLAGAQFEGRLFASRLNSELSSTYRWPLHDPRKEWLTLYAGAQHEDTDTSESDTFKLGVSRSFNVSANWLIKPFVELAYDDYEIADDEEHSRLLMAGINWESVDGRRIERITRGRYLNYELRGAAAALGSTTSFVQLRARGKWIRPLESRTRLLLRANLGFSLKETLDELPASQRFFAGGDRSVRGYEFESLGPRSNGKVHGGSHLAEFSIEIDRLIYGNWAAAIFLDSGSAFDNSNLDFSTGLGMGLRWHSPIGPIRLDLAHPLDDDQTLRIHVSMGPDL